VKTPLRGEVYMVDLGLAAKVRPCLVVSIPLEGSDRSLVTVVPHTTSLRQSRFEITAASPKFLRSGAFDVQGIVTVPTVRLMNRLGTLTADQMRAVEKGICSWLGINIAA
jgi:mRNA interferase MazF